MKYAVLNENNIAVSIVNYGNSLTNAPSNYIEIDTDDKLYHKYVNGTWSSEKYEPTPTTQPTPITLEELQANQLTIMNAIADLYSALPTSTTTTT